MKKEILRVQGLVKQINNHFVLRDVYLDLYQSETLGIVGLHDSGKTLLFNIICGNETMDSGKIFFNEEVLSLAELKKKRKVFLVSEKSSLIPDMNVIENIFIIRKHNSPKFFINHKLLRQQLLLYLRDLNLPIDINQKVSKLSRSRQYLVEIIKAYIHGAQIILIENITTNYTIQEHTELEQLISYLKKQGISFIINGYQLEDLRSYSDRILFLSKGRTVKVFVNKNIILDENRILLGNISYELSTFSKKKFTEKIFEANNISTMSGEDISFNIKKGEIVVILDLLHTTNVNIMNALFNEIQYKGSFMLSGKKVHDIRKLRRAICIADYSQDVISESLSLKDNLCLSAYNRLSKAGFINLRIRTQIEKDFLQLYHTNGFNYAFNIHDLSQPEKMAIYLYRTLIQQWQLLFIFNPETIIGYETVKIIYKQLKQMVENGRSICIFASTIEPYSDLADHFFLTSNGKIIGKFKYKELREYLDNTP